MNMTVFTTSRNALHGNVVGLAPLQTVSFGNPPAPPPSTGLLQMSPNQLQRIGEQH